MKISKITKIVKKAEKEAQAAVDKIYEKYSKDINHEIASQIPIGQTLLSGNGMCALEDENGDRLHKGNSWSITAKTSPKWDKISDLQYSTPLYGGFCIDSEIKGELIST